MKSFSHYAAIAASLLLVACSENQQPGSEPETPDAISGEVTLSLNPEGTGFTSRAPRDVYSSEATSDVNKVQLTLFIKNDENWVKVNDNHSEGFVDASEISNGVIDYPSSKVMLKNLTAESTYRLVAYAYKDNPAGTIEEKTNEGTFTLTVTQDPVEEIFAGSCEVETGTDGKITTPKSLTMERQVAGILGYFKNIPIHSGGQLITNVKIYACASTNSYIFSNEDFNGVTTVAGTTTVGTFSNMTPILTVEIPADIVTQQSSESGCYQIAAKGGDLVTVENSIIGGKFIVPFANSINAQTFAIAICAGEAPMKVWKAKLENESTYDYKIDIKRNHFYSFGKKLSATATTDDQPIDLSVDNDAVITLSNAWGGIHQMTPEED